MRCVFFSVWVAGNRRVAGLLLGAFFLFGCEGGQPEPLPPGAETAQRGNPAAVDEFVGILKSIEAKSDELLRSLQSIRTAEDLDRETSTIRREIQELDDLFGGLMKKGQSLTPEQDAELRDRQLDLTSLSTFQTRALPEAMRIRMIPGASEASLQTISRTFLDFAKRMKKLQNGYRLEAPPPRRVSMGGPSGVTITCKGLNGRNSFGVFQRIQQFNTGTMQVANGVVEMENVQDFDGLVAALKERVGVVEQVDATARKITVVVDSSKIPAESMPQWGMRAEFEGLGPGGEPGMSAAIPGFGTGGPPPLSDANGSTSGFGGRGFGAPGSAPFAPGEISDVDPFSPEGSPGEVPARDPDALLDSLKSGDPRVRLEALSRLAGLGTSETPAEIRKKVALTLRNVVFDSSESDEARRLAVRGMVAWGGKYAAPQLTQLLERPDPAFLTGELNATVFHALGKLKHPDTFESVAVYFSRRGSDARPAAECLVQFGSAAEPYVLEHCDFGDPMRAKAVLEVLRNIGTKKSLPTIESFAETFNGGFLRNEIAETVNAIRARESGTGGN